MPVVSRIKKWTDDANSLSDTEKKAKLLTLLTQAKGKLSDTEKYALKAERLKDAKTDNEKAFINADNATEDSEKSLAKILEEIYVVLDKQNVVQLDPVQVNFGPIPDKYDKSEYFSQLKAQEEGINALNVHDWLVNRASYSKYGRASSGSLAQAEYRAQIFKTLVKLRLEEQKNKGSKIDVIEARSWSQNYMDTQAALHDPDQIAGGDPLGIADGKFDSMSGLGSKRINCSIGSRWRTRVKIIEIAVKKQINDKKPSLSEQKKISMNSKLKM